MNSTDTTEPATNSILEEILDENASSFYPTSQFQEKKELVTEVFDSNHFHGFSTNESVLIQTLAISSAGNDQENLIAGATSIEFKTIRSGSLQTSRQSSYYENDGGNSNEQSGSSISRPDFSPYISPKLQTRKQYTGEQTNSVENTIEENISKINIEEEEEENEEELEKVEEEKGEMVEIRIGPQHFDVLKLLGVGAFGKVILVQHRFQKQSYAMKVISKNLLRKKNNVQYMKSERDILTKIQHPFLVSLQFAFQSETKLFLIMDFLAGGELFLHLRRRGLISEHEVQFYAGEIILALEFLHSKSIIHRDLKPENILLKGNAHICITDFGLAKEIGDGLSTRTLCGTSEYMAPEMLTRTGYGKAVDWWALGALCFEMLVGKPPFIAANQKELDKKIMFEKFSAPQYLTANAHALLKGLLDKDP
jgi:tRNA A-37 threonylcarbamoyl transferase component Bud32